MGTSSGVVDRRGDMAKVQRRIAITDVGWEAHAQGIADWDTVEGAILWVLSETRADDDWALTPRRLKTEVRGIHPAYSAKVIDAAVASLKREGWIEAI